MMIMSAAHVIPHVWRSFLKRSFLSCLIMIAVSGIILAKESEVVVRNGVDNVSLGGTLAEPDSVASKGAVLLLSGSGSQNRDEEWCWREWRRSRAGNGGGSDFRCPELPLFSGLMFRRESSCRSDRTFRRRPDRLSSCL